MDRHDKFREIKKNLGDPEISISQCILIQESFKRKRQRKRQRKDLEKTPMVFLPRSFKIYERIFKLGRSILDKLKIASGDHGKPVVLDVAGGCSNIVKEMQERGIGVVIADPVFFLGKEEIREGILEGKFSRVLERLRGLEEEYVRKPHEVISPEIKPIFSSLKESIKDGFLEIGKFEKNLDECIAQGAYVGSELPHLPFRNGQFELVLVGHFMFTEAFGGKEQCLETIKECLRVGKEVRIFPIVNEFTLEESPFLKYVLKELRALGYRTKIYETDYELYSEKRHGLAIRR